MMLISRTFTATAAPGSIEVVVTHLHYPMYFVSYIGIAKVPGVIALVIPRLPLVKERAYFGFLLNLFSASNSMIRAGGPASARVPILMGMMLLFESYVLYYERRGDGPNERPRTMQCSVVWT